MGRNDIFTPLEWKRSKAAFRKAKKSGFSYIEAANIAVNFAKKRR